MAPKLPQGLDDKKKTDLAEIKKRILDRDSLIEYAWLAGAQAGLAHAQGVYHEGLMPVATHGMGLPREEATR